MSLETPITFKFFCAKCRTVLDVKDYAPCRIYDGGFNGMSINPLPCDTCLEAARGNAVASHEARMKDIRDTELKAAIAKAVHIAKQEAVYEFQNTAPVHQLAAIVQKRRREERNRQRRIDTLARKHKGVNQR